MSDNCIDLALLSPKSLSAIQVDYHCFDAVSLGIGLLQNGSQITTRSSQSALGKLAESKSDCIQFRSERQLTGSDRCLIWREEEHEYKEKKTLQNRIVKVSQKFQIKVPF